jgi:glucose/arabinose dehydrogenase
LPPCASMRGSLATLLGAFALALAACGSDPGKTDVKAPTVKAPSTTTQSEQPSQPVGSGSGGVKLTKLGDFDEPLYVTQPPGDDRDLFVVERHGQIRVIRDGKTLSGPFLDVGDKITTGFNEQGLLSMAFAPDYQKSGRFYVDYTDSNGDIKVVEYRRSGADPLKADPGSARQLLGIEHSANDNHNGGLVLFGLDGSLYIGVGDGGGAGDPERNGQNLGVLLGKILRIDPRPSGGKPYGIPKDNPFVGRSGARPEIFDYGLRNPWRFNFDAPTGSMLIADVGQDRFEEVDDLPRGKHAGANLGWSAFEGYARFNDDQNAPEAVRPILTYGRDRGCSITGGYVVRDPDLSTLYGRYVYGDFCLGKLYSFVPALPRARDDKPLGPTVPALSSFGVDNAGHVYATSLEGAVYRLDPTG